MSDTTIRIGVAGWSLPSAIADAFPPGASHLARYAQRLSVVEINSSFYRPHQAKTYARWAATVPDDFRFSVKLPKAITHERRLIEADEQRDRFLSEIEALGGKLGPILIQLPPSLAFEEAVATPFFTSLRQRFEGLLACEPRHASWFLDTADALLADLRIARVAADPAVNARAAEPGGWAGLTYRRLHGAPKIYYSDYSTEYLDRIAADLSRQPSTADHWCVMDNTALGHAAGNALYLEKLTTSAAAISRAQHLVIPPPQPSGVR
ncbi:MAG: DUF72 domain-containing protein [Caulobacteraceae bacterium]